MAERLAPYGSIARSSRAELNPGAKTTTSCRLFACNAPDLAFELAQLAVLVLTMAVEETQNLRQFRGRQGTFLSQQRGHHRYGPDHFSGPST